MTDSSPPVDAARAETASATTEAEATGDFTIVNALGLHARAATKLVQLATRFKAEVTLSRDGQEANAKSVMGVLLLCGAKGARIHVHGRGADAQACVDAIGALIADRFGENE
jgi:phosphocarrier protein